MSILKSKVRQLLSFSLLQPPGEAGVVHVGQRVRPAAGDDAPGWALHQAEALVVVPLVPSPDDREEDDDDDLEREEDDGAGDHAGLVKTVGLEEVGVDEVLGNILLH